MRAFALRPKLSCSGSASWLPWLPAFEGVLSLCVDLLRRLPALPDRLLLDECGSSADDFIDFPLEESRRPDLALAGDLTDRDRLFDCVAFRVLAPGANMVSDLGVGDPGVGDMVSVSPGVGDRVASACTPP